jgi:hypothetical protein
LNDEQAAGVGEAVIDSNAKIARILAANSDSTAALAFLFSGVGALWQITGG